MLMMLAMTLIWAQSSSSSSGGGGGFLALLCPCAGGLLAILVYVGMIGGMWKAFEKAGEPGWTCLVPIYNMMIMSKIAGRGENYGLMCLIPCVGPIFAILILLDFCKKFDVGGGFVIGLLLLPMVFWPMLGFGSAKYIGGGARAVGRRRAVEDEEDDAPAPRPKPRRRDDDDEGEERVRKPRRDDY